MTTTTFSQPARAAQPRDPGRGTVFLAVVRAEWTKIRSVRSTVWTLLAAAGVAVGFGTLVAVTQVNAWDGLTTAERMRFDPTSFSLSGLFLAQLAIGVLGVLLVTGEYATGMIRATLGAVPRRLPVLAAKAALFASVTFVVTLLASLAAFVLSQTFLGERGTDLGAAELPRALLGTAGFLTAIAVLAVALGFLLRHTAGGIATLFGLLLVVPPLGFFLPDSWQDTALPYLPNYAGAAVSAVQRQPDMLSPTAGAIVLLAWALIPHAAAAVVLVRRDA